MLRDVFTKTLYDQRQAILWWSLGLIALTLLYVAPYQQILEAGALDVDTESGIYDALGFAAGPAGYLRGTIFGLIGPLLLIIAAIVTGVRAIAGEEESGTLDLLLAHPVSRTRVLLERFAAMVAFLTWLAIVVLLSVSVATRIADMAVPLDRLTAATLGLLLVAVTFGALALGVGALTGRRGLTLGLTAALAVASYLAFTLAPLTDSVDVLQRVSPFYYYLGSDPLVSGLDPIHALVLLLIPCLLLGAALWPFNHRDLAV